MAKREIHKPHKIYFSGKIHKDYVGMIPTYTCSECLRRFEGKAPSPSQRCR